MAVTFYVMLIIMAEFGLVFGLVEAIIWLDTPVLRKLMKEDRA